MSILTTANAHPDRAKKMKEYQRKLKDLDALAFAKILGEVSLTILSRQDSLRVIH